MCRALLVFMSDPSIHAWKGYLLAALFLVANFGQSQCYQHATMWSVKLGVQMRAALLTLLYRKALALGPPAEGTGAGAESDRHQRRRKRGRSLLSAKNSKPASASADEAADAEEKRNGGDAARSRTTETCANDVVNYMGVDLHRLQDCLQFLWVIWFAPLDLVLVSGLLYVQLGWCAFVGLGVLLFLVLFQGFLSGAVRHVQVSSLTSTRLHLIHNR